MVSKYFLSLVLALFFQLSLGQGITVYVSPEGSDVEDGLDVEQPKETISSALNAIQTNNSEANSLNTIILLSGDYYLQEPLVITPQYGRVAIKANEPLTARILGSRVLIGDWMQHAGKIMKLKVDNDISAYSNLFIDGVQQILARYPNYDSTASHYNGYAPDAIAPERVKQWEHPEGAILHVMHRGEWGGFHYEVESADNQGNVELKGGHQNNRPSAMHKTYRMVENVFEELDAPGEWYFDATSNYIYLYPQQGVDLRNAKIEVSILDHLIELRGTIEDPVTDFSLHGVRIEHTNRTFMNKYEPLLRSDWMIYRGGAIFMENVENSTIEGCDLSKLGGNAIFVSGYANNIRVKENHIYDCGANAISFVGLSSAVRSPSFTYREFVDFEDLDTISGPKTDEYPVDCAAMNNLIHDIGKVEKQVSGVQISMAMNISVSHNSIYDVPRSGINVSEGTWGGHIIEFNDVFNTVLESSDHGSFNSWGRDRFWHPNRKTMDSIMLDNREMPLWDAINTTIIRNNRMRCDHGWDIDLDDGSSNYHLYNNLCLNGGIKLREGFFRVVENNIMVNNGFHPHVWFKNSGDIFKRNIVMTDHKDIRLQAWGSEVDSNLFPDKSALTKAQQNGTDHHSNFGNPEFIDPDNGNFNVSENSPAHKIGFINFTMNQFGVQVPRLKKLAKQPKIPPLVFPSSFSGKSSIKEWLGAHLKNIETLEERSAAGLSETSGALITAVNKMSLADRGGLKPGDVIIKCEGSDVKNISDLLNSAQGNNWKGALEIIVFRDQKPQSIALKTR